MAKAKAYRVGDPATPAFPDQFEIEKKAVLQVTDIRSNHNKYYAIELHSGSDDSGEYYRVYTHYGRTDDLDRDPNSGRRETRHFSSLAEADANYQSIYRQKTSKSKGYKEVSLAASAIGSEQARGTSSGDIDGKTLEKLESNKKDAAEKPKKPALNLDPAVRDLVQYLFSEATEALTSTVNATITANGIQTPLGILTIGQIEKGEQILAQAYQTFVSKAARKDDRLAELSGEFYTVIPHRIGRTRAAVKSQFDDDEYVIYNRDQHRMDYLVEFMA
jgi:predicted DNA-binding WGR domain protein